MVGLNKTQTTKNNAHQL